MIGQKWQKKTERRHVERKAQLVFLNHSCKVCPGTVVDVNHRRHTHEPCVLKEPQATCADTLLLLVSRLWGIPNYSSQLALERMNSRDSPGSSWTFYEQSYQASSKVTSEGTTKLAIAPDKKMPTQLLWQNWSKLQIKHGHGSHGTRTCPDMFKLTMVDRDGRLHAFNLWDANLRSFQPHWQASFLADCQSISAAISWKK